MKKLYTLIATILLCVGVSNANAEKIKVGVLHSLSGTMAISETTLKMVSNWGCRSGKNQRVLGQNLAKV